MKINTANKKETENLIWSNAILIFFLQITKTQLNTLGYAVGAEY
jgi:hypothetical protein